MSEVADNKWELEASKPPLMKPSAVAQLIMMVLFAGFFAYILIFSVVGAFSEKKEAEWEKKVGSNPAAAAPAE